MFQSPENVRRKKSKAWTKRIRRAVLAAALAASALWLALRLVPFPMERLEHYPASVVLADREGGALRVRLGPDDLDCRPGYRPERGHWIAQAIVAAEDQRFWSHRGIDPLALARAVWQNASSLRRISGASTLSTQVIRLAEPRPPAPTPSPTPP